MKQQAKSTFVLTKPSEILEALVGLKDVRVLHHRRQEREVELMIEQIVEVVRCPTCRGRAQVKERPVESYVDRRDANLQWSVVIGPKSAARSGPTVSWELQQRPPVDLHIYIPVDYLCVEYNHSNQSESAG